LILNQGRAKEFWEFKKLYPSAIIAGGYLRDLYLGKTPKDIDVWLPDGEYSSKTLCGHRGISDSEYQRSVTGVFKDGDYEIIEVDWNRYAPLLLGGPFWKFVIERFDMGICQIAWDGIDLHTTEAFKKDVENKTITYLRTWNEDSKMSRIQRIRSKYPDWKFVDETLLEHPTPESSWGSDDWFR
jgi:hypothetical protein